MEALHGLISKELLELSYNDRNAINEEIHGVRCLAVKETPELLRSSLDAFQSQIDSMPTSKKEIYNEIVRLKQQERNQMAEWRAPPTIDRQSCCSFAEDEKFRLRFLRCELFNVQKAVLRFLRYLTTAYEFFGTVALSRLVRITDLSKSELRSIRQGCSQVLPYRDRAGRCVVVNVGRADNEIPLLDQVRLFRYGKNCMDILFVCVDRNSYFNLFMYCSWWIHPCRCHRIIGLRYIIGQDSLLHWRRCDPRFGGISAKGDSCCWGYHIQVESRRWLLLRLLQVNE